MDSTSRRDFLKATAATLGAAAVTSGEAAAGPAQAAPDTLLFSAPPLDRVRVGFVGVGGMGTVHLENYLALEGVELKAVCDIDPAHAERARKKVVDAGQPSPTLYTKGDRDFERMCGEEQLDLVFTATPWEWHVPVMLAALKSGKHAATEVPAAYRVDDCWALVEAAEKYKKHAVMMENCCYDRREMLALMLVRKGMLGELLHAECGYLHDLRGLEFSKEGEGLWRRAHAVKRNGNLYPTHGLGPIAQCFDINRGNQFDYLVSMSSPSRGLRLWDDQKLPADDPRKSEVYKLGDVNVTLIKTVKGQTIYLIHNTDDPRPYSRINEVQGTTWSPLRLARSHLHRRTKSERRVGNPQQVLRGVRASAVEVREGQEGHARPRRHGLPRGLPLHRVPARWCARRHERVQRRSAERRLRPDGAFGRPSQPPQDSRFSPASGRPPRRSASWASE